MRYLFFNIIVWIILVTVYTITEGIVFAIYYIIRFLWYLKFDKHFWRNHHTIVCGHDYVTISDNNIYKSYIRRCKTETFRDKIDKLELKYYSDKALFEMLLATFIIFVGATLCILFT
jgi:hypothetical protein